MSTADANNIGIKLQAAGENLNTWGDPNLNNALIVLSNLASKWNPLAINGDTTISETNYSTTNDTEVACIDLVAGTVAAAFNLIIPGRDKRFLLRNSTAYAATPKLSATTGFALPAGRIALVATDGVTDVVNMTPNFGGIASPTTGSRDIPAWSAVESAIATAGIPASAGTVLVSGTDTTAKYLRVAFTTQVAGLTTTQVAGLASFQIGTVAGASQQVALIPSNGYVGGFLDGGLKSSQFTPVVGTAYDCDFSSAGWTVNLGGMTTPQVGQEIKLNAFGNFPAYLLGTVNGQTNLSINLSSDAALRYCGSSWGWN